ncbi:hypothetical protein AC578_8112 [Pseudocercospora eumusae]|uniref:Secreted protein n=1 Tax=Pseudocercospora eumusae TaxID=321146 RepID=A0A139H0P2_9PEZI|nr:hypothetical protein AC578_8112 [Pseudocercospora eumusae]
MRHLVMLLLVSIGCQLSIASPTLQHDLASPKIALPSRAVLAAVVKARVHVLLRRTKLGALVRHVLHTVDFADRDNLSGERGGKRRKAWGKSFKQPAECDQVKENYGVESFGLDSSCILIIHTKEKLSLRSFRNSSPGHHLETS